MTDDEIIAAYDVAERALMKTIEGADHGAIIASLSEQCGRDRADVAEIIQQATITDPN